MNFSRIASLTAYGLGTPGAFVLAVLSTVLWAITGPFFHYSDTWQLVVNTGTTVLTFLAVFLIQNTQNRDSEAVHLKLDALIKVSKANNRIMRAEGLPEKEIKEMRGSL